MPMSQDFENRLFPVLPSVIQHFGTPFHILDELGIIGTTERLCSVLRRACNLYRNFFAVKANSNPEVLKLLFKLGMGFDCSSEVELVLARRVGAVSEDIFFTSNNTSARLFEVSRADGGCILNLDDRGLIARVPSPFPQFVCFRYNPGAQRVLDSVIGNPETCKYGVPHEQIVDAYRQAQECGATSFGLHTMLVSNERNWECHAETANMLLDVAGLLEDGLNIRVRFINIGGGLGIPYRPEDDPVDLERLAVAITQTLHTFASKRGWRPRLCSENGRYVLGPNGVFVARCITVKHGYREFRGVDASAMASIMRPPMYHPNGGYHHITVFESPVDEPVVCSVVGPACEDSDRFGWDRMLSLQEGQHVIVHDTGAHAPEMGNNYNNWPWPQMLILRLDGRVDMIAPAQTVEELVQRRYQYLAPQRSFTP
ncbi:MAG: hypothetical protein A3H59_01590 [Candidatus Jacksonbacteria bacterium RIFCSPLOWO2_02_FULL_43_9]|nr:MAG: Diaminopimelate decarboxylase [Parcubacteria group bacterium GW2011_GWA2_43_13]OGY70169.1 MAG: hypothetical protein A2986_03505 [Candidatus Jacksonbacteria bacterium RIFCSPLOWO2_01_FULL_44_13]OGY73505.1 MAG: hypothetical protein A3H59_01590 [Candidatus Jacksonbacteria bacterium RIFCSPLOWO2_02_FULL_43_9]HAZ16488.1 diaminopimelate decarboxylase [Candidatus Jacksonbacteria bacterium]